MATFMVEEGRKEGRKEEKREKEIQECDRK